MSIALSFCGVLLGIARVTLACALLGTILFTTGSEASPTLGPSHQEQVTGRLEPARSQISFRVVEDDYLNVRDGAANSYEVIGVLPPGATGVLVDECVGRWCHISWRAVSGWVNARFLRRDDGPRLPPWLRSTR
jgi:hypothetical protein